MLRALVDEGVRPDLIVGTSVGAVDGAFLASRRNLVPGGASAGWWRGAVDCSLLEELPTSLHVVEPHGRPPAGHRVRGPRGPRRPDDLPPPCPIDVQPMDFGHAAELIAGAEASARACLDRRAGRVLLLRHAS
ncbi:MAG: hypothetical protein M3320_01190 [Actinomycetota bacterium]|nr:hypothetical protein [Actinomycetota bacterium]